MVSAVNDKRQTPMHRAAEAGSSACVCSLFERGASITLRDKLGFSALQYILVKIPNTLETLLDMSVEDNKIDN